MEKIEDMEIRNNHKSQKTVKTASAIFSESLKSLKSLMPFFANNEKKGSRVKEGEVSTNLQLISFLSPTTVSTSSRKWAHIAAMVAMLLIIGVGDVWGTTNTFEVSGTFKDIFGINSGNAIKAGNYTVNGTSWSFPAVTYFAYNGTNYYQFGSSGSPVTSCTLSTSAISGSISSVAVTIYGAKDVAGTVSVSVGGNAFLCNSKTSASFTKTSNTYTFTGSGTGTVSVTFGQTTSKAIYLARIVTTYSVAACESNPTIGNASLNGSISLSSFPVQTTGWRVGANCAWSDFGFVWSSSVSTPTLESNGTASSGCTKIQKATDGTSTSTSHSITGSFNTSTSYYVRGYGKNGYASGTYQYTDVLTITPRSITFNSNGGSAVSTTYVNSGTKVTAPSDPTKTGYNFGEWQLNSSEFDFANTNVTSNITLVATWTAKTTTVSFNQNSGTGGQTSSVTATYDQAMPTPITTPTRVGYNFGGYYDGSGGTGNQYYTETGASARTWNKEGSTATLYAKWTVKNYSVTWMVNGSEWSGKGGSTNVNHGSHVSTLPTAPNPAEDACGDKFVGWTTVEEYTHGTSPLFTTADGAPTVTVEGNVTYYAVFADYEE